jgi:hypothetical protein
VAPRRFVGYQQQRHAAAVGAVLRVEECVHECLSRGWFDRPDVGEVDDEGAHGVGDRQGEVGSEVGGVEPVDVAGDGQDGGAAAR